MKIEQRVMTLLDRSWFFDLNNSEVPHVNARGQQAFDALLAETVLSLVVEVDGKPAGGMIAFEP